MALVIERGPHVPVGWREDTVPAAHGWHGNMSMPVRERQGRGRPVGIPRRRRAVAVEREYIVGGEGRRCQACDGCRAVGRPEVRMRHRRTLVLRCNLADGTGVILHQPIHHGIFLGAVGLLPTIPGRAVLRLSGEAHVVRVGEIKDQGWQKESRLSKVVVEESQPREGLVSESMILSKWCHGGRDLKEEVRW